MGNTTAIVRMALSALGADAADKEIKAYIRQHHPEIPLGQISLALRKIQAGRSPSPPVRFATNQQQLFAKD